MKDKIVIITGANSGIGKAAALKFATEGYRVIMACRNMEMSRAAQKEITEVSNHTHVDLMELDVSSFDSIRTFCSAFKAKYPRLDILIHNAAYLSHGEKEYKLSPEHIELTFATNTFGPFLMTRLLADHLEKSQDPRILHACTTNIKHFFDPKRKIDFDNLRGEFRDTRPYSVYKMYGDSKMALLMLTFKMAEEFKSQGIKVNALQINRVKLSKETIKKMRSFWKVLAWAQNLTNPLPSGMADSYFHICTSDEFKNVTGQLINHKREIVQPSPNETGIAQLKNIFGSGSYPSYATDAQNVGKIWKLSTTLTEG
ncbi:SDR family NAD(P)-dependent oxidoreductase [Paenibacillus validus]|uniref:SDR family NAD(P)-dependent oxidoreductase n=1 Tax=Paenibacillus validus TaxID=44253 RepID=UPI000FDC6E84|nr:SDR family NAD(P)-dependent oxidoreductase [Paenibacillus validus]MED4600234.1 SDR family NAD(P)-dependent oxidoreductase [Paenibacillus validus]MED4605235.1 SDR family NAD(P)-dependent oxidoreductase [Paenibacillus validus]